MIIESMQQLASALERVRFPAIMIAFYGNKLTHAQEVRDKTDCAGVASVWLRSAGESYVVITAPDGESPLDYTNPPRRIFPPRVS